MVLDCEPEGEIVESEEEVAEYLVEAGTTAESVHCLIWPFDRPLEHYTLILKYSNTIKYHSLCY